MKTRTARGSWAISIAALALALAGCSADSPDVSVASASTTTSEQNSSSEETSSSTETTTESGASESSSQAAESSAPTTAVTSVGAGASSAAPGSASDLVKFCTPSDLDNTSKECRNPATTLKGSDLNCSADLPSDVSGQITGTVYMNGGKVYQASGTRTGGAMALSYSVGKLQLPAGTYSCVFSADGKSWRGDVTVDGPAGAATQGMACDGSTMYAESNLEMCTSNSATLPGSTRQLGFSAVLTDLLGKRITATLDSPQGSQDVNLADKFDLGTGVVFIKAPNTPSGSVPPGDYTCTFKVDGAAVISIPVTVG
ncbi:hypothetical protein ACMYYO_10285 [Dermacoccaceae bacterium W4C1]